MSYWKDHKEYLKKKRDQLPPCDFCANKGRWCFEDTYGISSNLCGVCKNERGIKDRDVIHN